MYINVTFDSAVRGVSWYTLMPQTGGKKPAENRRLVALLPRIRKMARRQLGKHFVEVKCDKVMPYALNLKVRGGISRGEKRFELRELLGWIALCAVKV